MSEVDDRNGGKYWVPKNGKIHCQERMARYLTGNSWQFEQRFAPIDPVCSEMSTAVL